MLKTVVMLVPLGLVASGCGKWTKGVSTGSEQSPPKITQEELRDRLEQFHDTFEALVQRAAEQILLRDNNRRFKRLTILWQMRLIPMSRNALDRDNPMESLLDLKVLLIGKNDCGSLAY